jgi:flagellar basal-body rod modification protein FlgD
MATVTSTLATGSSSAAAAQTSAKSKSLTQGDFINLLVTQMKNQNPLEPMDNYQMASQVAQMSTVESLNKIYESVNQIASRQDTVVNSLGTAALIGKTVEAQGNGLTLSQGAVSGSTYQLAKAGNVLVQVYNSLGQVVWSQQAGVKDTTLQKVEWQGKDQQGNSLPDGDYTFKVTALDEKGETISVTSRVSGAVTGIFFEEGSPYVQVGSNRIAVKNIAAIRS